MIVFSGHTRAYTVPPAITASVGGASVNAWDLLRLAMSPDAEVAAWADKVLDGIVADAALTADAALDCDECPDTGFYAVESPEDPDILTSLLRGTDGAYDELTASGWRPHIIQDGEAVRMLSRELAEDLAGVVAAGADGLVLRYAVPIAWLPPANDIIPITVSAPRAGGDDPYRDPCLPVTHWCSPRRRG